MTWLRNAWDWLRINLWAAWIALGVVLVVIARVVFHGMNPVDASNQEKARQEWERDASRLELDEVRRTGLRRQAEIKAKLATELGVEATQAEERTREELRRIDSMDAEELAKEWASLRRGNR